MLQTLGIKILAYSYLIMLLIISPSIIHADEAADLYAELYKDKVNAAIKSRDFADNLSVAEELFEVVNSSKDQPAFAILLCDKIYIMTKMQIFTWYRVESTALG